MLEDWKMFYHSDRRGRRLWAEDDCTIHDPDHETLEKAFLRLCGVPLNGGSYELGSSRIDCGDGEWIRTDSGLVVWSSYPGGSEIWSGQTSFKLV